MRLPHGKTFPMWHKGFNPSHFLCCAKMMDNNKEIIRAKRINEDKIRELNDYCCDALLSAPVKEQISLRQPPYANNLCFFIILGAPRYAPIIAMVPGWFLLFVKFHVQNSGNKFRASPKFPTQIPRVSRVSANCCFRLLSLPP